MQVRVCSQIIFRTPLQHVEVGAYSTGGGGGANGEMANLTNEKGKFAIAIFRHFSPFFAIFRHW